MRKVLVFSAIFGSLLALLPSCSKDSQTDMVLSPAIQVVNATIPAGNTYQLVLDKWQNASISKQAAHFKSSSAQTDIKTNLLVYSYTPATGFTGEDEVVLSTKTEVTAIAPGNSGCDHSNGSNEPDAATSYTSSPITTYSYTYMTVKIKVTK